MNLDGTLYFVCDDGSFERVSRGSEIAAKFPSLYEYLGETVDLIEPKKLNHFGDHSRIVLDVRFSDHTGVSVARLNDVPISKFSGAVIGGKSPKSFGVVVTRGGLVIDLESIKQEFGFGGCNFFRQNIQMFMNLNHDGRRTLGDMITMMMVMK